MTQNDAADAGHGPGPDRETAAGRLCQMRELQVTANRAEMARARGALALFQQFSADYHVRKAADPHFTAAPLAETVTEVQPVTGQSVARIRGEVEQVLLADAQLPWLADHLDAGRLDLYRARPVTDAVKEDLADHPVALTRFSGLMETWFTRAVEDSPVLVNKTYTQIRNRVHYLVTKVLASQVDEKFKRRHRQRRVSTTETGDGMAALNIETDLVSVTRAAKHLDLLARQSRSRGDERTLEQLRTDHAIDLLTGGTAISTGECTVGAWARPIINVTVPIQTLMGLSDEPGQMGESVLPASLLRRVATEPGSTWHRMLTDPHRHGVELSTDSYKPTGPIVREMVATQPTCFAPTCVRPATECEGDHRTRWPQGPTSTGNIGPGCKRHHLSKHAPGASLTKGRDGTLRYQLRSGLTHLVSPAEVPVCEDPQVGELWAQLLETQPNLAELTDALEELRSYRRHRADTTIAEAAELTRLEADYRASYPQASDEDIAHWTHAPEPTPGSDPADDPPPILRQAAFQWDHAPAEPELSALIC